MYNCLPLYHSVGGVVAVGAPLLGGGAVVIRPRFSASEFWRDVREQRCTLFQYIGELCRYLVNTPPQPAETEHALRIACGNGLRPEVWEAFQHRFRIPRILEYYAATEGNFSLYNCEGKPGAIGRIPSFLAHRLPVALLRFDLESGAPTRGADGFCQRCAVGEAGEAVGLIADGAAEQARAARFEGYADRAATEAKVLRNVFKRGDSWYRTGDLMKRDEAGFYYFVDRVGETYRWKGENVSTAEVLAALCAFPVCAKASCTEWLCRAPTAAPAWRRWWSTRTSMSACFVTIGRKASARLCASGVPAAAVRARRHRHVQAAQARTSAGGLRPGGGAGSAVRRRCPGGALRAARSRDACRHLRRPTAPVVPRSQAELPASMVSTVPVTLRPASPIR